MASFSRIFASAAILLNFIGDSSASPLAARDAELTLPSYALTYAPYVYLYSGETYFPQDVAVFAENVVAEVNFTAIPGQPENLTLDYIGTLQDNAVDAPATYLTSKWTWESDTGYLSGIPDWFAGVPPVDGKSAPVTIIAVNKSETVAPGTVDVFYMYFYSFNQGGPILGFVEGDHVSDWEHTMVRFVNGTPTWIYFSIHSGGEAFTWDALGLTFKGDRPVGFSANGSHATFPKQGTDVYDVVLVDYSDEGYLWDPTLNYRGYWYDDSTNNFTSAGGTVDSSSTSWLNFIGRWGDDQPPTNDTDQLCILGLCRYVAGAVGPVGKVLNRTMLCQSDPCPTQVVVID